MKDDTISREAAINAADSADYTGLSVEDVKKVTDEVVKALKMLPSAQPEPCEDAVSRKDVLDGAVTHYSVSGANIAYRNAVPVEYIESLPSVTPKPNTGKWIPVTRIEKWHKEDGLVGFPPEVKEFPQCTIEWVDATEPDEVDGLRCSECGTIYDFTEARNWCSECGAKMEGQNDKD